MVKHTQTVHRLLPKNCLSVFDHFVGLALKGLKSSNLSNEKQQLARATLTDLTYENIYKK